MSNGRNNATNGNQIHQILNLVLILFKQVSEKVSQILQSMKPILPIFWCSCPKLLGTLIETFIEHMLLLKNTQFLHNYLIKILSQNKVLMSILNYNQVSYSWGKIWLSQ